MKVRYRKAFLKDMRSLQNQPAYKRVFELVFTTLPAVDGLRSVPNVKAMKGAAGRFRIRVGDYRVGIEVSGDTVEVLRVLHRRDFYRYFH